MIHYYDFTVGSFARIDFCLTLETGNKGIVFIANNSVTTLVFRLIRIRENRGKNEIELVQYFGIGNGGRVKNDCNEIVFLLITSSFRWRSWGLSGEAYSKSHNAGDTDTGPDPASSSQPEWWM